ncbi:MAG: tetratricopeptide repeat protein [Pseudomonadota bacterium]
MIDITLQNLETELVQGSLEQPVLLDIWAPWCGPCKSLGPVLERLETLYEGRFKLAKLNSDDQPQVAGQLSQMFGVRSIPFCVMFKGGQPVDGFVGALPEKEIREFLDKHVPSIDALAAEEEVAQAEELLAEGDVDSALARLREALTLNPDNDTARADYLRALLQQGQWAVAREVLAPVAGKLMLDARLSACQHWLQAGEKAAQARSEATLREAIAANKRDFEARFELAQVHFAAQRFTEALDELLEIVMRDKAWNQEIARKTCVAILELMTKPAPKAKPDAPKGTLEVAGHVATPSADPVVDGYRRKLSMALF